MNDANIFIKSKECNLDFLIYAHKILISSYEDLIKNNYSPDGYNENRIRDDLVKIAEEITRQKNLKIDWNTESRNLKKTNRIDITLSTPLTLGHSFDERTGIECKIVGTGHYVNRNGINSFISGVYCEKTSLAGMIGFIKSGDINKKIKKIETNLNNHPTIKTIKNITPLLIDKNFKYSYISEHERESNLPKIDLYHLFFDFTKQNH